MTAEITSIHTPNNQERILAKIILDAMQASCMDFTAEEILGALRVIRVSVISLIAEMPDDAQKSQ